MKQWYSAKELVGLAGMPSCRENIARKARVENWKSRRRSGRGGGQEYARESLPRETQTALFASSLCQTGGVVDPEDVSSSPGTLWAENEANRSSTTLPAQPITTITSAEVAAETFARRPAINLQLFAKAKTTDRKSEQRTDSWLEILKAYVPMLDCRR